MKKLVYIIGAGRSGTTLLEIIISNGKGIFSIGELNRYPDREGVPPRFGPETENYQFWKKIGDKVLQHHNLDTQQTYHRKYEYHLGLILQLLGLYNRKERNAYRAFLKEMYADIYQSIEEDIIIESSKYPGRALNLARTLPYEISFVYLKRDPVQVIRSFKKQDIEQPPKHWTMANAYYFAVNLLCNIVIWKLRRKHKVVSVKYEELTTVPEVALQRIQDKLGIDLSPAIEKIKADQELKVGYLFEGNRIRTKPSIKVQKGAKKIQFGFVDYFTRGFNYLLYH